MSVSAHAGHSAWVMLDDTHAAVFIDDVLVRHFKLDKSQGPTKPRASRVAEPLDAYPECQGCLAT